MCRILDSSVLGYLGEDSVGNGKFEKGTETGPHKDSDRKKKGDNDDECSDFWDSEYMDSEGSKMINMRSAMGLCTGIKEIKSYEYKLLWSRIVRWKETKEACESFLGLLKADLGIERPDAFTFVSDKQKGLIPAFELVFPGAENRFSVRHLHEYFKKAGFRGLTFKIAPWNAAKTTTVPEFELRMKEMGDLDESVVEWFNDKPPSQWSRSHFQSFPKCDILLNNLCESLNSGILEAREKSILTMLEWIKKYLMTRLTENRDKAKNRRPATTRKLGANELRDKGKRGKGKKGPVRMKKQSLRVQCHYCGNTDHNRTGCKRRKADIVASLTRDFAAPINANVGSGNEAGPSRKVSTQKRRTNVAETIVNDNSDPSTPVSTQASTAQSRKSSNERKSQKAAAHVSASGSIPGSVFGTLSSTPSAPMPKEGSQQPKLIRTFSIMANRPPRHIAAPVMSQFRPPSIVMDPALKTTPMPQPRVNIRCPPPFAPNHPILSQTLVVNS
ncbi:hypothetical protein BUALT_Bualt12G0134600 [Buddleja alternifolia]|uniref:Transposase n=1 Tax=Buddleja alternifolia TaxID=168488 RepID=A0AAV6WPY5_9LAMI|nr:hypothetical protein BUALT_Bualt12G0134600 [Buddleja alternifolia]